jgi:short-subunit dehydrogenase
MGVRRLLKNYFYRKKYNVKIKKTTKNTDQNILITGSNSAIGYSLTKKLLNLNNVVYACYNKNSENLLKINNKNLHLIKCDQSNLQEIDRLKNFISNKPINIIINNAGTYGGQNQDSIEEINFENFKNTLTINALSTIKLTDVVIRNSKSNNLDLILNISSGAGSITKNNLGNAYIYRVSKSTLNSISKNMSVDLKKKYNINVVSVDPGNVKTKMNVNGLLDSDICANNLINIIENSNELNGKFIDLLKNEIPW